MIEVTLCIKIADDTPVYDALLDNTLCIERIFTIRQVDNSIEVDSPSGVD